MDADDVLLARLGVVLREFGGAPGRFAGTGADRVGRRGVTRVGRAGFAETLVEAYDGAREAMIGYVVKELRDRTEAEDVVQSAFMRVFARRPDIEDVEKLRAYLWTTVRNLTNDALRRVITDRERRDSSGDVAFERVDAASGPAVDHLVTLRRFLLGALDTLPAREREAVVLRGYGGYSLAQTAAIMGVAVGTVKGYEHRGLNKLRRYLDRTW